MKCAKCRGVDIYLEAWPRKDTKDERPRQWWCRDCDYEGVAYGYWCVDPKDISKANRMTEFRYTKDDHFLIRYIIPFI